MWALSTNIPVYYPKGEELQQGIRNHSSAPLRAWEWNVLSLDFVFDSIELYGLRDNSSVSEGLCIYCPGVIPRYATRCLSSSFCINWYASDKLDVFDGICVWLRPLVNFTFFRFLVGQDSIIDSIYTCTSISILARQRRAMNLINNIFVFLVSLLVCYTQLGNAVPIQSLNENVRPPSTSFKKP